MAQGKLKVKTSVPQNKNKKSGDKKKTAAQATRRNNAPIKPKKTKFQEAHKLKQMITKTVNHAMENELREKALDGKKGLIKKKDKDATTSKSS